MLAAGGHRHRRPGRLRGKTPQRVLSANLPLKPLGNLVRENWRVVGWRSNESFPACAFFLFFKNPQWRSVLAHQFHCFRSWSAQERQFKAIPKLWYHQLISHPSRTMLRVIINRLKPKAEEVLAEEQAGFRPGRNPVEQILQ